jgi:hypothetical protein
LPAVRWSVLFRKTHYQGRFPSSLGAQRPGGPREQNQHARSSTHPIRMYQDVHAEFQRDLFCFSKAHVAGGPNCSATAPAAPKPQRHLPRPAGRDHTPLPDGAARSNHVCSMCTSHSNIRLRAPDQPEQLRCLHTFQLPAGPAEQPAQLGGADRAMRSAGRSQ